MVVEVGHAELGPRKPAGFGPWVAHRVSRFVQCGDLDPRSQGERAFDWASARRPDTGVQQHCVNVRWWWRCFLFEKSVICGFEFDAGLTGVLEQFRV